MSRFPQRITHQIKKLPDGNSSYLSGMVIDGKLSSRTDNVKEMLFSNRILYVPQRLTL